ncbi:hypothetical protein RSOL_012210 [Rhizoctonia solani AG-3 Rhs1AP]|uniref:F-box domain-containing protein n=2 Tax=Rhizoctonia solani AG-3 TaxID=1086053 RepID=A0A074RQW3_9AGAM|nr:hypothetical protein RSOL_012210 [Rhizoctonia solani AG-3 Rhs1AP]KEP47715.1 hypothetical protein V565_146480 [Rhizoctonia solani 123E]
MGFAKLPSEILYKIGQIMANDSHSVSSLCIVNKWTHQSLATLLYRSVRLGSDNSVSSFCDTITSLNPGYSNYVVDLWIGSDWCIDSKGGYRLQRDIVPQIRRVLQSLVYLKHLSLPTTTRNALNLLFANLNVPFQLDSFAHRGQLSKPLLRFLEGQPSITRLGCHVLIAWTNDTLLSDALKSKPNLFKNLRELESPDCIATILIRARPISNLTIIEPAELLYNSSDGIDSVIADFLTNSSIHFLTHAMVPITRICITEKAGRGNLWAQFIKLSWQRRALHNMKELCILLRFPPELDKRPVLKQVFSNLNSFSCLRFDALEKFEIAQADGLQYNPPPSEIINWLDSHNMGHMSSWREHNPMLRSVILYGYVIPEVIYQESVLP